MFHELNTKQKQKHSLGNICAVFPDNAVFLPSQWNTTYQRVGAIKMHVQGCVRLDAIYTLADILIHPAQSQPEICRRPPPQKVWKLHGGGSWQGVRPHRKSRGISGCRAWGWYYPFSPFKWRFLCWDSHLTFRGNKWALYLKFSRKLQWMRCPLALCDYNLIMILVPYGTL